MFPRPSSVSISMCYFQGVALELSWGNSPEPPVMNPWFHACFPFFSLKPHGGFLKWGFPKWMVYNGQSYLNGWFGGTPIVHTGPERPGWSWACSGLAPYSLPSVQVGVDWGVLQITWSDTYSICCELTRIDREFWKTDTKLWTFHFPLDCPPRMWQPSFFDLCRTADHCWNVWGIFNTLLLLIWTAADPDCNATMPVGGMGPWHCLNTTLNLASPCEIFTSIHIIIPPGRGCRPEVYHVTNSLGFVWGLFKVCLGFIQGFI